MVIFIYLTFLFFLGLVQVLSALTKLLSKKTPPDLRAKIKRYGLLVCSYFSLWAVAAHLPVAWMNSDNFSFTVIYVFVLPLFLAFYYTIINRDTSTEEAAEYKEIEQLIF